MGEIIISLLIALGLTIGQHQMHKSQDQGPPPNCTGSGCGLGGGGGGGF